MKTRIILQDNLWFRGEPQLTNYVRNGRPMVAVTPRQGFTSSGDAAVKARELRWLNRYTRPKGRGLVIAQQWHGPGNLIDRNLVDPWLPTFETVAPEGRWCIFYDPVIATRQRRLLTPDEPIDFGHGRVMRMWKRDLAYLRHYFDHPQYWRLNDGHPVLYVWASFVLRNTDRAFEHARRHGLYVLADVLGTEMRPAYANGLSGFTVALPGLERHRHRLCDLMPIMRRSYDGAASGGFDFIPAGSCQYDDTAFIEARGMGERPLQVLAADKAEIESFLALALSAAQPIEDTRYLFWGTLNNWAEGTTLLPTTRLGERFRSDRMGHYQFAHLEAVRDVVFA